MRGSRLRKFGNIRNQAALADLDQVEQWLRQRFKLEEGAIVLVSEQSARLAGFPPLDTVITFWSVERTRYRLRIFKSVAEINENDFPPDWLLASLEDFGDGDCC